ncbi:MAG: hypothetical protein GEV10_17905 [Streptosporangiales bacterium]|nr:hypothetical protein [Streptosporangiales bacterium]
MPDSVPDSPSRGVEVAAGLVIVAASGAFLLLSLQFAYRVEYGRPGPGFLPLWASLTLGVFGLVVLLRAVLVRPAGRVTGDAPVPEPAGWHARAKPALALLLLVVVALVLEAVGFVVTAKLFSFAVLVGVERVGVIRSAIFSVLAAITLSVVFARLLEVPLPIGILRS